MTEFLITLAVAVVVVVVVFGAMWWACDVSREPLPVRPLDPAQYAPAAPVPAGPPTPPTGPALTRATPAVGWATETVARPVVVRGPRHGAPLPVLVGTGAYRPTAGRTPEPPVMRRLNPNWREAAAALSGSTL